MSFLDKSSLIVDAVITKLGREKLSQNDFVIAKFALGDDEVDYRLYNESNTQGPNNYGIIIENMPVHQAFLTTDLALKYKLVTQDVGSLITPEIDDSLPAEIELSGEGNMAVLNPSVVGGLGDEEFIYELQDNQDVVLVEGDLNAELGGG
jgi:hypothetical protein|tara:strand:- start:2805 stop:3254 length:450 start_codon:yes stop_codon:yes gene_type:complete